MAGIGGLGYHTSNRRKPTLAASFGSPRWTSQTGGRDDAHRFQTLPTPPSEDAMIARRTDFLEKQGKTLSDSLSKFEGEKQRLQSSFAESTRALYSEMQWVFAKSRHALEGRERWNDPSSAATQVAAHKDVKLLLVYPMKQHAVEKDGKPTTEYLMRCKTVNANTGQIAMCWVVVHETCDGKHTRHVHSFSFH